MRSSHERPNPQALLLFYAAMAAVGAALTGWRGAERVFDATGFPGDAPLRFLLLTTVLVAGIHLLSLEWMKRSAVARRCGEEVVEMLGHLTHRDTFLLAVASGVGEELLFRGFLMNETGLWVSSLVFGIVHVPPNRNWLAWPVFAAAMGLLLGWLCLASNTLIWAMVLHAGINYLNLRLILRSSPGQ